MVTREDLTRYGRRLFAARCATGDWDMVIMTHETFASMPVPAEVEREWLDDQLAELEDYKRSQGNNGKRIAAAVRSLEGRIERLRDVATDDDAITFDMLGIDYLAVDEADRFRRLPITTRAEGFSMGASKRATDLLLKLSMLRRANPSRPHASLFTGTPPYTNTLAEAFVWQRFCDPDRLTDSGLGHFDAWAAQFVRYETLVEVSPDGSGFRSRRRPVVIQNVPELRTMIGGAFMSMVRSSMTDLTLPTPHQHTIVVQPTDNTRAFMTTLVKRADDLRARRVQPDADNMLAICGGTAARWRWIPTWSGSPRWPPRNWRPSRRTSRRSITEPEMRCTRIHLSRARFSWSCAIWAHHIPAMRRATAGSATV